MSISSNLFNSEAQRYADNIGYLQKERLYECISSGDLENLEPVLNEYFKGLSTYVKEDVSTARDSMRYIWAQLNVHMTKSALSYVQAREIQGKYYFELEQKTTVAEVYEVCRALAVECTTAIAIKNKANGYSALVKKCQTYIRNHIYDKLTVCSVAKAMHFSQSWISHKFRAETGMTMEQFIRVEKISEAEKLLHSNMSLSDIASILGFSSQSHFTEAFRKVIGTTPKQYRKDL